MTPQELLDLELHDGSTLQDVFKTHDGEMQFGTDSSGKYYAGDEEGFYLKLAQKIIDAVNASKE